MNFDGEPEMLVTNAPKSAALDERKAPAGAFRVLLRFALILCTLAALPALASYPEPEGALSPLPLQLQSKELFGPPAPEAAASRSEFKVEYPKDPVQGAPAPSFLLQKGEYGWGGFNLFAEMGDIRIKETRNTVQEAKGRGGRFQFLTGNAGNSAKFETFAAAGAHGGSPDDMLVGATGELALRQNARFKTIFLSGRESLDKEGRWPDAGSRRGDVLGFVAQMEPFRGAVAEAEYDYSVFDKDTSDENSPVHDSACRVKLGGGFGVSRYTALYERTGPRYRLMTGGGPERDTEGVSLGVETALSLHAFDVKLSRYNDNTDKNDLYPRLYRYQGAIEYRFLGLKSLPLALQYKKTFIDSTREPLGYLPKEAEEEAVSGQVHYLAGKWDLGVRGGLAQRSDRLSSRRESSTTTFGFLPRYAAGSFTLAPDFSLKKTRDFANAVDTDQYSVNLGLSGSLLEKKLDYELKGGYRKEVTGTPGTGKESVGAKVKAGYPLARLFKWSGQPVLGVRGEYKESSTRIDDRRESDFSLLISLDGATFL